MLHSINLFPWREQEKEKHKRRFVLFVLLGIIFSLGIEGVWGAYFSSEILIQHNKVNTLTLKTQKLEARMAEILSLKQEYQSLSERVVVIERLQNKRNNMTVLMDVMPTLITKGVYLDKIRMTANRIDITGVASNTKSLAMMLNNLEVAPQISDIDMHSMTHGDERFGDEYQSFKISFGFIFHPSSDFSSLKGRQHDKSTGS